MFFFFFITFSYATNYYASPEGTGTGTFENPCAITSAWGKLSSPGDTLFLRGGVYYLNAKQSINKTGTTNARICIFAYPGETPILDFRNQTYGSSYSGISLNETSSYMHIKGITIRYAGDNGMINNGDNHIIENCVFYGNCDSGLQHKTGGGNLIKNCDSYDNFDYQTGGTSTPNYGGNADGFADKQFTNTTPNTYDGCRSWRNSDDGWDLYQRIGDVIIKNCICYKNGPATYDLSNHPRLSTDASWFSNFSSSQLAAYTNYGNANGFKIGGDYRPTNTTLTNCLSAENGAKGFDQNNSSGIMTLYNCTAYNNGNRNYAFADRASNNSNVQTPFTQDPVTYATLIIKNCVSLKTGSADSFTSSSYLTTSNNSWNTPNVSCTAEDFISTDASVLITPREADGSLPNTVFMQLADNSDLIDAGVFVSLPYNDNAPDLGCYERGNLDNFPPAVTTPVNKNQSVIENTAIEDIVFTWSAGAIGLTICNLPDGLSALVSETTKTLTITGTPNVPGVYNYTVTSIGGVGPAVTITGKLSVSSANAKILAYVTIPNSAADAKILDQLNANIDFNVSIFDATATTNVYTDYDLIVLSPFPNSGSAGLAAIEAVDKPKLLLKPFQLGSTRWNWGTATNTSLSTVTINEKTHTIFTGLPFTGSNNNELQLFSSVSTYGVTGISSWVGSPNISLLGVAKGTTTQSIVEIPIGTNMNGTTTTQRFLMIGISEYSTANLTATATQLIENACYYLLGIDIPSLTKQTIEKEDYMLSEHNGILHLKETIAINSIEIFSINGKKLTKEYHNNQIDITSFPKGIYIVRIIDLNGNTITKKFIKQ